jgi:rRNA maturation RNase YbeY
MQKIHFFSESIDFDLSESQKITTWIEKIITKEGFEIKLLNYIFCNDEYLHQINLEYLNHDTYTDIITFDNSEKDKTVESDIFISVERVRENATKFDTSFENELARVLIHGVLHLLGYPDKSPEEAEIMRNKEQEALGYLA